VETLSRRPMSRISSVFPLKTKADVRDATRNDWILVRALMISSAIPSVKYSLFGSGLMLTKGRTATDFAEDMMALGGATSNSGPAAGQRSAWANEAMSG